MSGRSCADWPAPVSRRRVRGGGSGGRDRSGGRSPSLVHAFDQAMDAGADAGREVRRRGRRAARHRACAIQSMYAARGRPVGGASSATLRSLDIAVMRDVVSSRPGSGRDVRRSRRARDPSMSPAYSAPDLAVPDRARSSRCTGRGVRPAERHPCRPNRDGRRPSRLGTPARPVDGPAEARAGPAVSAAGAALADRHRGVPAMEERRGVEAGCDRTGRRWRWRTARGGSAVGVLDPVAARLGRRVVARTSDRIAEHVVGRVDAGHPRRLPLALAALRARAVGVMLARELPPALLDVLRGGVVAHVEDVIGVAAERRTGHRSPRLPRDPGGAGVAVSSRRASSHRAPARADARQGRPGAPRGRRLALRAEVGRLPRASSSATATRSSSRAAT